MGRQISKDESVYKEISKLLLKQTNNFGYPLWQENDLDLVILGYIKEWLDDIHFDHRDKDNKKVFTHIKEQLNKLKKGNADG